MNFSISWKQGDKDQEFYLEKNSVMIGSLLSSQIQLQGNGVDPIHALIEPRDNGWVLTDLGTKSGVYVNENKINVEVVLNAGDQIRIGSISLQYRSSDQKKEAPSTPSAVKPKIPSLPTSEKIVDGKSKPSTFMGFKTSTNLFAKTKQEAAGETLEVIAYWKNTVLNVEHFHLKETKKSVTIGDPTRAAFIAAGPVAVAKYTIATVHEDGSTLFLLEGMEGSLRRGGKLEQVGPGTYELKNGDFAKIQYGAVTYFFLFMNLPAVTLPRAGIQDPVLFGMSLAAAMIYLLFTGFIFLMDVKKDDLEKEKDMWAVVEVPKPIPVPEPLAVVKAETTPVVDSPPEPMEAVAPKEKQPARVETPPPPKARAEESLTQAKTQEKKKPLPVPGGGLQTSGGEKKGSEKISTPGSEAGTKPAPSGANLSQLGIGVGKISAKMGDGAIPTNFKTSAGGAGKGSGSADKNYGLGGLAGSKKFAVGGSGGALNQFGIGEGIVGDGKSISQAFKGKGQVAIDVRAGDPLVSAGLTQEEILRVVRLNLNQIKNCYERWLQRVPAASGKVMVQFVVGVDGSIETIKVASGTISDSVMTDCLLSRIQKWKFSQPRGGKSVTVNYPFNFDPI